jgi:hypothetical protein
MADCFTADIIGHKHNTVFLKKQGEKGEKKCRGKTAFYSPSNPLRRVAGQS